MNRTQWPKEQCNVRERRRCRESGYGK
uniref:Uncharacterized protein n=1 Tax=Anguilla anguilla TaxID=7936 RepID=A0A0E9VWI2_ANGAN